MALLLETLLYIGRSSVRAIRNVILYMHDYKIAAFTYQSKVGYLEDGKTESTEKTARDLFPATRFFSSLDFSKVQLYKEFASAAVVTITI